MKLIKKDDGKVDIIAVQGKTWQLSFKLTDKDNNPIDVTDAVIRGQIRKTWRDTSVIATWTIEKFNPSQGEFRATLPSTITANIQCGDTIKDVKSQYVYDIEIEFPNEKVMEIVKGRIFVEWEVTR